MADRALADFAGSYPDIATPSGVVRTFDLAAAPTERPLVDGKKLRVWAYNGQVPGPTLRIRLGETIRVRFTNNLPQDTTSHTHGVRLPNAMDGVPYVTQQTFPKAGKLGYACSMDMSKGVIVVQ